MFMAILNKVGTECGVAVLDTYVHPTLVRVKYIIEVNISTMRNSYLENDFFKEPAEYGIGI